MFSRSFRQIQCYDPFAAPPDVDIALKHRQANLVGEEVDSNPEEICPCCYKATAKKQIDLRSSIQEIKYLGEGIALYFKAIKMGVMLLSILLLLFLGEWIIYHHLLCRHGCEKTEINILSSRLALEASIDLKFCIAGIAVLVLLTFLTKKYYDVQTYLLKKDKVEPQQFTLLLEGFPKCNEDDVRIWVQKRLGATPVALHPIYDVKEIKRVIELKEKDVIARNKQDIKFLTNVITLSQSIEKELLDKKDNIVNLEIGRLDSLLFKYQHGKSYNQTGSILVVFYIAKTVEDIFAKYSETFSQKVCRFFKKRKNVLNYAEKQIVVKRAPNPRDCFWENFHQQGHLTLQIIATVLSLCFAVLLLVVVVSMHNYAFVKVIWPSSFLISFFLYLLFHLLLHLLVEFYLSVCRYRSYTRIEVISYYAYGYFNVLLVCILPYSTSLTGAHLLEFINLILLIDALIHPIIKIFNLSNIYRKVFSAYIINLEKTKNPYPQDYLNRLMEGRDFKLGESHHYILRGLFLCTFYSHVAPFALLYYITSLVFEYWVQKYLLLRKCKIPPKFSSELSSRFVQSLGILPIIYVLGVYKYTAHFYSNSAEYDWIFILLLVVAKVLSILLLVYFNGQQSQWKPEKIYTEVENDFDEYYQLENEIIKYNGQLKDLHKDFANRMTNLNVPPKLEQTIDPLLELEYKNSEVYSPQIKNSRARLIKRLLSTSIDMGKFTLREADTTLQY